MDTTGGAGMTTGAPCFLMPSFKITGFANRAIIYCDKSLQDTPAYGTVIHFITVRGEKSNIKTFLAYKHYVKHLKTNAKHKEMQEKVGEGLTCKLGW